MALPVDYLSKIPQFAGKTKPIGTVLQLKAKYINHHQALNWMAEQTALIIGYENGCPDEGNLANEAVAFLRKHEDNSDINLISSPLLVINLMPCAAPDRDMRNATIIYIPSGRQY